MSSNLNMHYLDVYHKIKELLTELDGVKDPEKFISLEILARISKWKCICAMNSIIYSYMDFLNVSCSIEQVKEPHGRHN